MFLICPVLYLIFRNNHSDNNFDASTNKSGLSGQMVQIKNHYNGWRYFHYFNVTKIDITLSTHIKGELAAPKISLIMRIFIKYESLEERLSSFNKSFFYENFKQALFWPFKNCFITWLLKIKKKICWMSMWLNFFY